MDEKGPSCDGDDDDTRWDGASRREAEAGKIVTLQEAVADFDVALRDHRQKRRGLLGSAAAVAAAPAPAVEIPTRNAQGGTKGVGGIASLATGNERNSSNSPKQNLAAAVNWLDGAETSWSTVDFEGEDLRDPTLCSNHESRTKPTATTSQRDTEGSQGATVTASGMKARQPEVERTSGGVNSSNGEVQVTSRTAQSVGGDAPVPPSDRVQFTGVEICHTPKQAATSTGADEGATTGGELGAAGVVEQRKKGPEFRPSSWLGEANSPRAETGGVVRRDMNTNALDVAPIITDSATEESHGPRHDHSECDGAPPPNQGSVSPSPHGTQSSAVSGVETTLEGGIGGEENYQSDREKLGLKALAARPPGPSNLTNAKANEETGERPLVTGRAADGSSATADAIRKFSVAPIGPAAAITPGKNISAEVDPTIASAVTAASKEQEAAKTMPHSESPAVTADHQRVTAPAVAAALESPDPISTADQRTASNWMQGTTSGRPPLVRVAAEAEAELAERVDRLRSERLAADREERESLDAERAARFGREHAERSAGFAEEDRQTLAAEEARLADLRREAELGRLQRGAEFEETDVALGALLPRGAAAAAAAGAMSSGGAAVPVRGMRPQHYNEADDLPDGVREAVLPRPADRVVDELEGLARRAKAAGGGMNLEEFQNLEQRQRARQVERHEILHGQTAEEKSYTMLKMVVRLQKFARLTLARRRVARLRAVSSASKERVRERDRESCFSFRLGVQVVASIYTT